MAIENKKTTQGTLFEGDSQVTNPEAEPVTKLAEASPEPSIFAMTKGNWAIAVPATASKIVSNLADPDQIAIIEKVRAIADEAQQKAMKKESEHDLTGLCPHYSQFNANHRTAADANPECCTYTTCVDVDDRAYGQQAIDGAKRLTEQRGTKWYQKVLYIENSLRGGGKVHIFIRCPLGMTVAETQQEFCQELGIPCDESVQQKQSFILMTGDVVYQSDQWLKPLTEEQRVAYREAFSLRGLGIDGWPLAKSSAQPTTTATEPVGMPAEGDVNDPTDATDYVFEACMKEAKVLPADLLIENEPGRHNSVRAILSVGLPQMMSKADCLGQLRHRAPQYFTTADCQRLVNDFYTKYNDTSARLTQFQRNVLAESRRLAEMKCCDANQEAPAEQPTCDELTLSEIYSSELPPRMNRKKMPRLLKAITSRTPSLYVETVAQACFPSLEAHPVGLSFRHPDGRPRELRANCLTIAPTGVGKACVDTPIKHIMADIEEADAPNRKKLRTYNENYNTRNSNENKPKRPKLCIRSLMPNLTQAALAQRTEDANGAPLFCRLNEVEQFDKIENASGAKNQFTNLKINDDENNDFGQERAGTQSVNVAASLFLNWNASTTPSKAIRYFKHVMVDGPISRLCLATIPDPGIGAPQPVFGEYDEAYDDALKPYIDNLNKATGYINCPQAKLMYNRLKAECDEFALVSQDRVWDNLTHRALTHAFRKACCLYAANGMRWEKNIEIFCRWSLHYDLFLKTLLFGDAIRDGEKEATPSKTGPRNMLELLPDEFTFTDVSNVRFMQGMGREGTANQIYQWKHRKLILQLTTDSFKKAPKKI